MTERRCVFQKVDRLTVRRELGMRFVIAGRDDIFAEQLWSRFRRLFSNTCWPRKNDNEAKCIGSEVRQAEHYLARDRPHPLRMTSRRVRGGFRSPSDRAGLI